LRKVWLAQQGWTRKEHTLLLLFFIVGGVSFAGAQVRCFNTAFFTECWLQEIPAAHHLEETEDCAVFHQRDP